MQLIIVSETRSSCRSDYKYVKSVIDYFYRAEGNKLTPIYAKTKSELVNKHKDIIKAQVRYSGTTKVIIVADYDNPSDPLNNLITNYCNKNQYEVVWMNITVEEVFLNKIINKDKGKEADNYLKKSDKILPALNALNDLNPLIKHPSSNLMIVLDKYLKRKT